MKTTKILELNTVKDVVEFCNAIVALKKEAPGSLRFTVAITAEQDTAICQPVSGNGTIEHHAKVTLDRFDKQQRPKPKRKPVAEQPKPKRTKRKRSTARICNTHVRKAKPYCKPKRTARPVVYGIEE